MTDTTTRMPHGGTEEAPDDDALARQLAGEAGALLLDLRRGWTGDAATLRAEGDRRAHTLLAARLAELRPDDGVLSEEGLDDHARLGHDRVWVVDPLDGTREFGEPPRDDWAVHVALCLRGAPVVGAVARPARGDILSTAVPRRPGPRRPGPLRLAVSRSRPPKFVTQLAERLEAELVPMGSAGIKAGAVVDGVVDAYVHAGGQYEWDSAAPVAVARAAGLHTSRIDGSELVYNQPDPLLPDLVVARPEVAPALLAAIRTMESESTS